MPRRSGWIGMVKDWGIALLVTVAVLATWGWLNGSRLVTEGEAPGFVVQDTSGAEHALDAMTGRVVVLGFWATWCGPCLQEIPELQALHASRPDLVVLGISIDEGTSAGRVEAVARQRGARYPVVHDASGEVARAYGVSSVPTTVVIDRSGRIRATRVGAVDRAGLERMVAQAAP